jgi:hypothetical protein
MRPLNRSRVPMAKEDPETEDTPFEIPKFDEDEFVRKELISFRTTVVLFVYTIIVALISFAIWNATGKFEGLPFFAHFAIAIGLGLFLPFIFRAAKIDISHWRRREWIGTFFMFFFFWMGFSLILTNPPISDEAPPTIQVGISPQYQFLGQPVHVGVYVVDNEGLRADTLQFCIHKVVGAAPRSLADLTAENQSACRVEFDRDGDTHRHTFVGNESGLYAVIVSVEDDKGQLQEVATNFTLEPTGPFRIFEFSGDNRTRTGATFSLSSHSFRVCLRTPPDEPEPRKGTKIARAELQGIQHSLDGIAWHFFQRESADTSCWTSFAELQGWSKGTHRVHVRAVYQPVFVGTGSKEDVPQTNATHPDGPFTITISNDIQGDVGTKKGTVVATRVYRGPNQTPGFEAAVVVVGVLVALLFVAKKDRRHGRY